MGQDTLGLQSTKEGAVARFFGKLLFIALLIILFWSPTWFGTPQNNELQKTLVENSLNLKPADPSVSSWVAAIYVALFQYSYPNRYLEILLFCAGAFGLLALLFGAKVRLKTHNVTYAGIGWALLMLAVMASGKMCKIPEFRDNWGSALFILYGVFFYLATICLNSAKKREIACVIICLALLIVSHGALIQQCGGLERTRDLYAQKLGFDTFAKYSEAFLSTNHTPEELFTFNRLASARVTSTFTSPNILASYLMVAFFVALGLARSSGSKAIRYLGYLAAALALLTLFLTRSKSVIVIVSVLFIIWSYLLGKFGELPKKFWLIATFGALVYTALAFLFGYGANLGAKLNSSGSARLEYAKVALRMARQRVLQGYGVNSFARWFKMYAKPDSEPTKFVHNTLLQMWAEFGIFAGLGWLLAMTLPMVNGWDVFKSSTRKDVLQLSCILAGLGFFVHCLIDFDFYVPGVTLTALFIMAAGLNSAEIVNLNEAQA